MCKRSPSPRDPPTALPSQQGRGRGRERREGGRASQKQEFTAQPEGWLPGGGSRQAPGPQSGGGDGFTRCRHIPAPKAVGLWVWQLITDRRGVCVCVDRPRPSPAPGSHRPFRGPAGAPVAAWSRHPSSEAGLLHPAPISHSSTKTHTPRSLPSSSPGLTPGSCTYNRWTWLFTCLGALLRADLTSRGPWGGGGEAAAGTGDQ